jgi:hypothetical protein
MQVVCLHVAGALACACIKLRTDDAENPIEEIPELQVKLTSLDINSTHIRTIPLHAIADNITSLYISGIALRRGTPSYLHSERHTYW